MKTNKPSLVLASSSAYRRDLLSRLVKHFEQSNPNIDEARKEGESPKTLVTRLAIEKAHALAAQYPESLIIGSDQIAINNGDVLGKPGNRANAIQQLTDCSGRTVEFLTAVALFDAKRSKVNTDLEKVIVTFRTLSALEIERYIDREQPFDCAGSFKCEGLGISLFKTIRSDDPNALIGLPMIKLNRLLIKAGVNPLLIDD